MRAGEPTSGPTDGEGGIAAPTSYPGRGAIKHSKPATATNLLQFRPPGCRKHPNSTISENKKYRVYLPKLVALAKQRGLY